MHLHQKNLGVLTFISFFLMFKYVINGIVDKVPAALLNQHHMNLEKAPYISKK